MIMNITENNKSKISKLLQVAIEQLGDVEGVTVTLKEDFDFNKFVPYILNDKWPQAVDPLLIADPDSEEDQVSRAHGILSIVVTEPVSGNFLDFGCGDGYVVAEAAKKAFKSVGYDIEKSKKWDGFKPRDNQILTTSWDEVVKNGPYDTILIYDVLDHLKDEEDAVEQLKKLNQVVSNNGKIFLRCHPWCSRHGTHLYLSANRAYLHLCLDDNHLKELGYKQIHTIKVIHPLLTYERWFGKSGWTRLSYNIVSENVEPFFFQTPISTLIKKNWSSSHEADLASGEKFPEWQLKQCFVDNVLIKTPEIISSTHTT